MLKRAILAAGLLASASGARAAIFGVDTAVFLQDSSGDYVVRGYNPDTATNYMTYVGPSGFQIGDGHGSAANPVGDSGLRSCTVFNCSAAPYGGVSTTGTTDQTGGATSAFDTLAGSDVDGPASASISGDLSTGTLRATASGSFGHVYGGEDQFSGGYATGVIYDTLHFTVAGASASTVTPIEVELRIDGLETATHTPPFGYQAGYTAYTLAFGATVVRDQSTWTPGTGGYPVPTYAGQVVNDGFGAVTIANVATLLDTPEETDVIVTYDLTGASIDAGFADYFGVGCQDGVSCDFAHTSRVSFILPSDVSYTSDSGVFLTQTGGVPEPASWALMLAGLGLSGAALRRRSSSPARAPTRVGF